VGEENAHHETQNSLKNICVELLQHSVKDGDDSLQE
jgi:hypothetical protein